MCVCIRMSHLLQYRGVGGEKRRLERKHTHTHTTRLPVDTEIVVLHRDTSAVSTLLLESGNGEGAPSQHQKDKYWKQRTQCHLLPPSLLAPRPFEENAIPAQTHEPQDSQTKHIGEFFLESEREWESE